MMRATDEFGYMKEVCKIVVDDCGYSMVWIGLAQDDEGKTVTPLLIVVLMKDISTH